MNDNIAASTVLLAEALKQVIDAVVDFDVDAVIAEADKREE